MTKEAHDILEILAPPLSLVNWLDASIADKKERGKPVPPEIIEWLDRWKAMRADGPAVTDAATPDDWRRAGETIGQRTLINVSPAKKVAY